MQKKQYKEENEEEEELIKPLSESGDIESHPSFKFIPKGHHEWRQEGGFIVCRSCDLEHALYIGTQKMLVGLNETGEPILVNRDDYFKNGYSFYDKKV